MKRSVRLHQKRAAAARRVRILLTHGAWSQRFSWQPKIWQQMCRLVMNEPGWWVHEYVIAPARTETRRLEHAVLRGRDPDRLSWPDYKRPHVYYW